MPRPLRVLAALITPAFAIWCILKFRSDVASTSFAPLLHAWSLLAVAAALSLGNYLLRTLRWRWYLAALGHRPPLYFVLLTYVAGFAYTLSPAKLGELMRARYYSRIGIPMRDVTVAFLTERLMDVVAVAALATFVLRPIAHDSWIFAAGSVGTAVLLLLLVQIALRWVAARRSASGAEPASLLQRLKDQAVGLISSGRPLLTAGACAVGLGIGVAAWGMEGLGLGVLSLIDQQVHLPMFAAVGIYGTAVVAGALSFVPGGLGSTEAVMVALLAAQGISVTDALVITLACRIVTLWFAVGIGWLAVLGLRLRGAPGVSCHAQS